MKLTKKQFNAIRHNAFISFVSEVRPNFGKYDILTAARISEGTKMEIWLIQHSTQINNSTLQEAGFSPDAKVETLFHANKQTKTLDFPAHKWE